MILGLSTSAFTTFHVVLSLIGIGAGLVVVIGMLRSKTLDGWTAIFLGTTILTSITGFFFPVDKVLPSHIVGVVSLVVLAAAVLTLYIYRLRGSWRWIYAATATLALYLKVFVLVVQGLLKVPFLHALAPGGSEPPFVTAQSIVLVAFLALGFVALRSFHPESRTEIVVS